MDTGVVQRVYLGLPNLEDLMGREIHAGKAFIKTPEHKAMTSIDHERVLTLKEATRGQNPETYVSIRVKDLDYLTAAVLEMAPPPEQPAEKPVIDGGFTKANETNE